MVQMDLLNKHPRAPITFRPGIDNMSAWPQKCMESPPPVTSKRTSLRPHLCDGGGSVVVRGGAVGVGPGPLLLLLTGCVLVTGAEHRSSVPVQDRQPGNVGRSRLSEDTVVRDC